MPEQEIIERDEIDGHELVPGSIFRLAGTRGNRWRYIRTVTQGEDSWVECVEQRTGGLRCIRHERIVPDSIEGPPK